ncbi:hypothetical protein [Luteibacter sp. 22Crub2.1]|uniref:hypothetical protein n=1 Tax=Luteibacter sp. 22Crub2.1 TaxID=1283288 RepID=UPI0009A6BB77|nr:hypothetical protein [Luteibacter sp. 22Crub2.1]SKB98161.1 hypothetical protein SAMN05660880_03585 [Luteibacter sp. 22Crub2.1]
MKRHLKAPRRVHRYHGRTIVFLLLASAHAVATPTAERFHAPPSLGDAFQAWTFHSLARMDAHSLGDFHPLQADVAWRSEYLKDPGSIYSDLHPHLFSRIAGEPPRPDVFPADVSSGRKIAWDLGFDKALIGYQVLPGYPQRLPVTAHHPLVSASLEKAGVRRRYFDLAYKLSGTELSMITAEMAVALEVLRHWVDTTPVDDRGMLGVNAHALGRFEAADNLADIPDADLAYLADVLRLELSLWNAGRANAEGSNAVPQRELPTPLRIARVAAAYRTSQPPLYTACLADGQRDPATSGDNPEDLSRPICFTDATDRAVYRWYRAARAHQLAQAPEAFSRFDVAARLIDTFADVRPAWAGAYTNQALDWSNHVEVVEAQMALAGDASGSHDITFYRLVERANLLICRRSLP